MSRIDSIVFSTFFDDDFRLVKEHEFRKAVFKSKITISFLFFNLYLNKLAYGQNSRFKKIQWLK